MLARHLLIIDDDLQIRRAYERVLRQDFVVECAGDVETAIATMDGSKVFDAILCDLNLPGMTGRDLYAHLTLHSPDMAERMVVITGEEPAPGDEFTAKLLLTERYLVKTCSADELRATMRRVASPRSSLLPAP